MVSGQLDLKLGFQRMALLLLLIAGDLRDRHYHRVALLSGFSYKSYYYIALLWPPDDMRWEIVMWTQYVISSACPSPLAVGNVCPQKAIKMTRTAPYHVLNITCSMPWDLADIIIIISNANVPPPLVYTSVTRRREENGNLLWSLSVELGLN